MENKYGSKAKYYQLLGKLVNYIDNCRNDSALTVSETTDKLSSGDLDKWDKEYYQSMLEDAKLEVQAWAVIKEVILTNVN